MATPLQIVAVFLTLGIGLGILGTVGFGIALSTKTVANAAATKAQLAAATAALDSDIGDVNDTVTALSTALDAVDIKAGNRERFIETVVPTIFHPVSYANANVTLRFDYFYTKSEHRLRVTISLPDGYNSTVATTLTDGDHIFDATGVMPVWACNNDTSLSQSASWFIYARGDYFQTYTNTTLDNMEDFMVLSNDMFEDLHCGDWVTLPSDRSFFDDNNLDAWLGANGCLLYNDTSCFPDFVGEMVTVLTFPADIEVWDAHYDLATS